MKIIVPVSDNTDDSNVDPSLSRAPYYMVYDSETGASESISNSAKDSPSGAGVKAAQTIVDAGAEVLLTVRCGDRAYNVLNGAGIKIMSASPGKAKDNIDAYLKGNLSELDTIHEGHHHGAN